MGKNPPFTEGCNVEVKADHRVGKIVESLEKRQGDEFRTKRWKVKFVNDESKEEYYEELTSQQLLYKSEEAVKRQAAPQKGKGKAVRQGSSNTLSSSAKVLLDAVKRCTPF